MELIQTLIENVKLALVAAKAKQERMAVWATVGVMGVFSGQAHAANFITKTICDLKNYVFEDALIGACATLFISSALVMYYVEDDNKLKGKIVGALLILGAFAGLAELLSRTRFASC
jgi:hydrogenase/urease accessory protein HupE